MQISRWLTAGLLAAILSACGGGDSSGVSSSAVSSQGTVVDDQGIPLSGATIKVIAASAGVASASTENDGSFSVLLSKSSAGVIRVEKAGFMPMIRAAGDAANNANFAARVVLLPVASTQTFDSTQAAVLRVPGSSARVELAASSLVRTDGQAISGSTTVQLTPIDPSKDIRQMPGVMVDAASGTPIESLGALSVTFTDASGAALNLASGQTATIRIPATPAAGATLPATFPLYHLNETTGLWEQEGTATLQTDPATGDKYYEGTVSHFSTWNADQVMTRARIDYGFDVGGNRCQTPAAVSAQGIDYNGVSSGGDRLVSVRIQSRVRLTLYDILGQAVDSVVQSTPTLAGETERIARCLVARESVEVRGQVTVSSGSLSGYRVQITSSFPAFTVPIAADGTFSTRVPKFLGDISAKLVQIGLSRGMPDTSVTATVESKDVVMPALVVEDRFVELSGCVQGWTGFRQRYASLAASINGRHLDGTQLLSSSADFRFLVPIDSSVTLRLTPPDGSLRERVETIAIARSPVTLSACISLPSGPLANMVVTGAGLTQSFNATSSVASDTPIATYHWDFGDGTTGSGAVVTHTYATAGVFNLTLTVTDRSHQSTTLRGVVSTAATVTVSQQSVAVGRGHGCALTETNGLRCWGYNYAGQLGSGDQLDMHAFSIDSPVPVDLNLGLQGDGSPAFSIGINAVSAGSNHTCAISTAGAVLCWGGNASSQLGSASFTGNLSTTPVSVSSIGTATAITAGDGYSCALDTGGTLYCWGRNSAGQLGFFGGSGLQLLNAPTAVASLGTGNQAVSAGSQHTCAINAQSVLFCWGYNGDAQLGTNGTTNSNTPLQVPGLGGSVTAVAASNDFTCAIASGAVKCWGEDPGSSIRDDGRVTTPTTVPGLSSGAIGIAVGNRHGCAVLAGGELRCWGENYAGQLGLDNTVSETQVATVVPGLESNVVEVRAGNNGTCARLQNGTVKCWGRWFVPPQ
ncbi:PKD domain containing protein [Comamonadaceae bacterium]